MCKSCLPRESYSAPTLLALLLVCLSSPAAQTLSISTVPVAVPNADSTFDLSFPIPSGFELNLAAWHPGGAHIAVYERTSASKWEFWVDMGYGLSGPFEMVDDIVFSPDGRRVACSIKTGYEEHYALEGGKRSGPWSDVAKAEFSPDSSRFLFLAYARGTGRTEVVVDFKSRGQGSEPGFFSGSRWFFRSWENGASVHTDSGLSGPWSYVANVQVSPDGSEIMFSAKSTSGEQWICSADKAYGPFLLYESGDGSDGGIVLDSSTIPFLEPRFGPDGHTPRYFVAQEADGGAVWILYDGSKPIAGPWRQPKEIAAFPIISANLKRIAFIVREGDKYFIEESEGRLGPFANVRRLTYSADGSTFVAQVQGAGREEWLYGSGYKAGPFHYIDAWRIVSDGSLLQVYGGYRNDGGEAAGFWTRKGELFEAPPLVEPTPPYPAIYYGPYAENTETGAIIHGKARTFGPIDALDRIYGATRSGGVIWSTGSGSSWRLWADEELLLAAPDGRLSEGSSGLENGIVTILSEDKKIAFLAMAGKIGLGLSIVDLATGKGHWKPIGRDE